MKGLQEDIGETLQDIDLGKDFLSNTPQAQAAKAKTGKWDHIKFKSFCTAKETINRPGTVAHNVIPALWEVKVGRSPAVRSSRPAWPIW